MADLVCDAVVVGAGPAGSAAARALVAGGMKTLLIEKRSLPRPKICSGLLSQWTVHFIHRKFGVIPPEVYTSVPFLDGIALSFPSLPDPVVLRSKGPIPYVRRDRFDQFLARAGRAEIRDGLRMVRVAADGDGFELACERRRKDGRLSRTNVRAAYLVGADGSNSRTVRCVLPEAYRGAIWATGVQMHLSGKVRLDPLYFHTFFHLGIGFYAWANLKDGQIVAGSAGIGRNKALGYFRSFLSLLEREYALENRGAVKTEGMAGYLLAPLNRFVLGKGNLVIAGDAAGFMHSGGEGISCALTTGDLAGDAIVTAAKTGRRALDVYRETVRGEAELCLDQANPLRMFRTLPMSLEYGPLWQRYSLKELALMAGDLKAFWRQQDGLKETGLGKASRNNMVYRALRGHYPLQM
ncbi:MAG: FAD-dependent monooxygenase [bacterium]